MKSFPSWKQCPSSMLLAYKASKPMYHRESQRPMCQPKRKACLTSAFAIPGGDMSGFHVQGYSFTKSSTTLGTPRLSAKVAWFRSLGFGDWTWSYSQGACGVLNLTGRRIKQYRCCSSTTTTTTTTTTTISSSTTTLTGLLVLLPLLLLRLRLRLLLLLALQFANAQQRLSVSPAMRIRIGFSWKRSIAR